MGQQALQHINDDCLATPPSAAQLDARCEGDGSSSSSIGECCEGECCEGDGGSSRGSGPECRICLSAAGLEELIQPCDCCGTLGYIHESCLATWVAEQQHVLRAVRAALQGALCTKAGALGDSSHAAQEALSADNDRHYGDSHTFQDVSRRLDMPHVSCDAC